MKGAVPSPSFLKRQFKSFEVPHIQIAQRLGISHAKVFRILNGYQPLDPRTQAELENFLAEIRAREGNRNA